MFIVLGGWFRSLTSLAVALPIVKAPSMPPALFIFPLINLAMLAMQIVTKRTAREEPAIVVDPSLVEEKLLLTGTTDIKAIKARLSLVAF